MPARLTQDLRNTLQSLLQRGLSFSKIKSLYPGVGNSTLTRLRKLYCPDPARPLGGRPKKLGAKTMSLVSRGLRSGALDNSGAAQESLRLMGHDMSINGIRKSLRRNGLKSRRKVKTNFVSKTNKLLRLAWAKKHRHLTIADWSRWVFSDETRINLWGSDAEGPGYGTTIIEGSVNSDLYVDILKTSLVDTLEHFGKAPSDVRFQQGRATPHTSGTTKQWFTDNGFNPDEIMDWPPQSPNLNPIEHVWHLLKLRLNKYPNRPSTKEELEWRINIQWYKITEKECQKYIDSMPARIKAVIKSKGGSTHY
ncbi:uncharacterized protein ATC70_008365 [Mucor velutinosus]|uniref:Tc1-like transposase DDE domain-containing protein n=1 Tax=Mucor velutinosus TaxID=708070 RepID=A0AAN7DN66_9FUNG|nr:hypothetical protein ATC70_008365 [Mucor velutinosus]